MFQPYVVGQSGTDRPEPVLVTRLPARSRRTVKAARKVENRCSITCADGQAGQVGLNPAFPARAAVQPFVRGRRTRGFEGEVDVLRILLAERDALRHRPQ